MQTGRCPNPQLPEDEYRREILRLLGPEAKVHKIRSGGYSITTFTPNLPTPEKWKECEERGLVDLSHKDNFLEEFKMLAERTSLEKKVSTSSPTPPAIKRNQSAEDMLKYSDEEETIQSRVARIRKRVEELTGVSSPVSLPPPATPSQEARDKLLKWKSHSLNVAEHSQNRQFPEAKTDFDTKPMPKLPSSNDLNATLITVNPGDDLELSSQDILPYKSVKLLGVGGSAGVEMVLDSKTDMVYARKTFRNIYTRNIKDAKQKFRNEVQVMRRLASHHHIIKLHATYIIQRELALILSPVADSGDLAAFLQDYRDADVQDPSGADILHMAFGCLASGLSFMHQQRVRHKDIKPQNVLIHQGSVIYTDFGIALDFLESAQSTTIGALQALTRRYCAPEVEYQGSRNSKSDVFSLGCVYIEILAALMPEAIPDAALEGCFFEKVAEDGVIHSLELPDHAKFSLFKKMLSANSQDRPSAADIAQELRTNSEYQFCDACISLENTGSSEPQHSRQEPPLT